MLVKKIKGVQSVHFESVLDVKPAVDALTGDNAKGKEYMTTYTGSGNSKWFGPTNKTGDDVYKHALLGDEVLYKEHLLPITETLNKELGNHTKSYRQAIKKVKRRKVKKDFGDEVDIHAIYQGNLDKAWRTTERVEVDSKHHLVTLVVDIGGNAVVSAIDSLWRTAVTLRLVDELQSAGKAVQVVVSGCSERAFEDTSDLCLVTCTVKKYNENLSMERLAGMTSLAFYRTFGFASKFVIGPKVRGNLGSSKSDSLDLIPLHVREDIEKGHTKAVIVKRADSLKTALTSLNIAYEQMKTFSDQD